RNIANHHIVFVVPPGKCILFRNPAIPGGLSHIVLHQGVSSHSLIHKGCISCSKGVIPNCH
uniref:Uncharacterized protein n=1 Tax=Acanthochromis polyacanthus TaxID=80966 RepID=A0A3Q1G3B4_9TELE